MVTSFFFVLTKLPIFVQYIILFVCFGCFLFFVILRYDELLREERASFQEVTVLEKKFESWSQLPAPATAAADVRKAASVVTISLPPAVAAFEVL